MLDLRALFKPGKNALVRTLVQRQDTAGGYSAFLANLLATPALVDMVIRAAIEAVDRHLPEGYATIGHSLDLTHEAPTCLGMTVTVKVTLTEIEDMKLRFEILVWDDLGEISRGHHERIVVNKDEFVQKTQERLQYMVERNL